MKIKRQNRPDRFYYNKGTNRKKQIYNWLKETIMDSNFAYSKYNLIKKHLSNDKINQAKSEFKNLIYFLIQNQDKYLIGYIIEENISKFGGATILNDLFTGIFGYIRRIPKSEIYKRVQPPDKKTLNQFLEEETGQQVFGYRGKEKVLGNLEFVVIRGIPYKKVRDKNGRFLSNTPEG